ncbi:MAG: hypothetical protein RML15_04695 [Bacteroidota bacterium]|nr:hypothetical protein [Bacteroidota bacterium]
MIWCARQEFDLRLFNWSILETIAEHLSTPALIMTESDVVLHKDFSRTLLTHSLQTRTIVTAFPAFLSPELSDELDPAAIRDGEPFRTWGRTWKDSLMGRSRYARRMMPLGMLGMALDRCSIRRQLSSTALAMGYEVLTALLEGRNRCSAPTMRALLRCTGIRYRRATYQARHAKLTERQMRIFVLAPVGETRWNAAIEVFDVRPVLQQRHRLN